MGRARAQAGPDAGQQGGDDRAPAVGLPPGQRDHAVEHVQPQTQAAQEHSG